MLSPSIQKQFAYPYEEFAGHIRAMDLVRQWEDTSRFGHLGKSQTRQAHTSRVVEYFLDSYADQQEAVKKAELFLSIYDYIARNEGFFCRKALIEKAAGGVFSVEPALLRAVHYILTSGPGPAASEPRKVLALAKAFQEISAA